MIEDSPLLEVGFALDMYDAQGQLKTMDALMGDFASNTYATMQQIEKATGGAFNMGQASARVSAFGAATDREMVQAARSVQRVEKAGERLVGNLNRQIEVFGKTRSEIRQMRAELQAVEAEGRGMTELAARIRGANAQLNALEASGWAVGKSFGKSNHSMMQFGMQINDVATMAALGAKPTQIFASQIGQIVQIAQQADGGMKGFAMQLGGLAKRFWPVAAAIGAGTVGLSLYKKELAESSGSDNFIKSLKLTEAEIKKVGDTGITMGDVLLGTWDVVSARAVNIAKGIGQTFSGMFDGLTAGAESMANRFGFSLGDVKDFFLNTFQSVTQFARAAVNGIIGGFVGGFNTIVATWRMFPAAISDLFFQAVNAGIRAINSLISSSVGGVNSFLAQVNTFLPEAMKIGSIAVGAIGEVEYAHKGAAARIGDIYRKEAKAAQRDYVGAIGKNFSLFGGDIGDAIARRNRSRVLGALGERDRQSGAKPDASKSDKAAENALKEARAAEQLVKNLYALADAYRISGLEALKAEARAKAETDALQKGADVAMLYERELRTAIAQRVADAAKASAAVRDQLSAQAEVNSLVEQGLIPAAEAAQIVKDRIADLPLLAALQAAQERQNLDEITRVSQALADQQEQREKMRAAEAKAAGQMAVAKADDQIALLKTQISLIGQSADEVERAMAAEKALQEARGFPEAEQQAYIARQVELAETQQELAAAQNAFNQELSFTADLLSTIDGLAQDSARGMADAFGSVGTALGDALTIMTGYHATEQRLIDQRAERIREAGNDEAAIHRANQLFALQSASLQVGAFGDMASAAKGFFKEKSAGYKAMMVAEQAFRAVEFALSVRAMAQDASETVSKIANSAARTAKNAVEAVVNAIKSLPFPANLVAGAATAGAIAALGVSIGGIFSGGGGKKLEAANEGKGTVFGDADAQSESIRRSIESLREVDILTANYSRQMLGSLRSIDSQIGGLANVLVRAGNLDTEFAINEGFKSDSTGKLLQGIITGGGLFSKIPIIGGILGGLGKLVGSLFGSKTEVVGSGLYGSSQSLGSILSGGFDAQTYADIKKTKKFFGIKTGTSYSTQYGDAPADLENQFTLILRSFSEAIGAAAVPLGQSTSDIMAKLNGFVVNIGKIDTKNMTGTELQAKLEAIFGAAGDQMALSAFPMIASYQKAGEGAFETLARVASSVETVSGLFDKLGRSTINLGIDAQLALIDQFEGIDELTSATDSYFETFYTREEQAQAKLGQFTAFFDRMGITLPATLAGFRELVEAQDLTTIAGRETYATLLQVAPAFAELRSALNGARSAADILAERQDLQRQLLELQGNTAAIRELDLAKLDESNRALQMQIWALEDAQEAAQAATDLRDAWKSVGDTIEEEIRRIRGIDGNGGAGFAVLQGQFNAASLAARGGDIEAAKGLPGLSQALLQAAEAVATSKQELDRVKAVTAASLEQTNRSIADLVSANQATSDAALAAASVQAAPQSSQSGKQDMALAISEMRAEITALRSDTTAALASISGHTAKTARIFEDITADSGGDAIKTIAA